MHSRKSSNPSALKPTVAGTSVRIRGWLPGAEQPFYDANHLLTVPKLDSVHISGTPHAHNLDALTKVGPLKRLHLEIYNIDQVDILERIDASELVTLTLVDTAPKRLDLSTLKRFTKLETLNIRHEKNLSAIGEVTSLKKLDVRLLSRVPCDFISELPNLQELNLTLGAHRDISAILSPRLRRLEVTQVRYLEELGDLARFPALEKLFIQNQPRITKLRASHRMDAFREFVAHGCPALETFEGMHNLTNLRKLDARGSPLRLGNEDGEPYFER